MTTNNKGRNGLISRATPRNDYTPNHTSSTILERHFCYCRPSIPCIFCLTWNRLIRRIESREVAL
jgi:hypothetical protein